jgi:hypothetical protein
MSSTVPASVPSLTHSSLPAMKNTFRPAATIASSRTLAGSSFTAVVPLNVPSLLHSFDLLSPSTLTK